MKINHEETKNTKEDPEKIFVLFVSSWLIFRRSLHVALRRPERMRPLGTHAPSRARTRGRVRIQIF
jgi:hypothetical protein